ncbi:hypothetical protein CVV65_01655 [Kyrpidia spormannii]|uniref:Uracil-DNA glycosylase-like domain-containing protein n=1 Tax=Kyrpidia spormannii TaxID=2055160 RepID=A0A2K8N3R6_9BACL|nr:hypothetical protein [Kyrpidia spormannii]ATY83835.1 hypothetical protein CVV65_01655 [Kyrpidia spormannii]
MVDSAVFFCSKCRGLQGYTEYFIPVEAFGNSRAPVVMLSLNPSHREYTSIRPGAKTHPLYSPLNNDGKSARDCLNRDQIQRIRNRQRDYFQTGEHLDWFDPAERFLNMIDTDSWGPLSFGINHLENVANVDIVKCPTDPVWGNIKEDHDAYISNCIPWLIPQLFNDHVKLIFVNGSGVYKALKTLTDLRIRRVEKPQSVKLDSGANCEVYYDKVFDLFSDKFVFLTGTSCRISKDHYGQFHEGPQRERVAEVVENVIQRMGL